MKSGFPSSPDVSYSKEEARTNHKASRCALKQAATNGGGGDGVARAASGFNVV